MISVQEAKTSIHQNLPQRQIEPVTLPDALGKIIAEDIFASEPSPRDTNSAMDGFAVRWEDVRSAESVPVMLPIIGESQAGIPFAGEVKFGQGIRICTGAILPEGTDTIIPIEDVETEGNSVRIGHVPKRHQHVRFKGEEFESGQLLIKKGCRINPARIALLASLGIAAVPVYRATRVAIIATGEELVAYDTPEQLERGQIRNSNGPTLAAAVKESGGMIVLMEQVGDEMQQTLEALQRALAQADIILFCGGVSVGPHDLVKPAAQKKGFETLFWKVRQKPGKPLFFAKKEAILLFGLPGNPVASLICYLYYVHPVIAYFSGKDFTWGTTHGKLTQAIHNNKDKPEFLRVSLEMTSSGIPAVQLLANQNSYMLTSLTEASGFIFLDANSKMDAGDQVEVTLLPWER